MSMARRPEVRAGAPALLLGTVLVLTALNLRAAVTSVGPVLRQLQLDLGMSDTVAGVLTTLPVVCFGLFGLLASRVGRRLGVETALIAALATVAVGLAVRALAPTTGVLLLTSLVALAGIGVGNVLVPVVVKAWFPYDVGRATGWYSMAISAGTALPAALTVPAAGLLGGWRGGLGVWALPAAAALLPWWWLGRTRRRRAGRHADPSGSALDGDASPAPREALKVDGPRRATGPRSRAASAPPPAAVHRQLKAWALAGFFGLQSLEAYTAMGWLPAIFQDAGVPAGRAGVLLAVTMVLGMPISLLLPRLAARSDDQRVYVVGLIVVSLGAYLGLILAPAAAPLLWAVLLGIGLGAFPLALVLIGLRASSAQGTAALSSLAQGAGYILAATGPVTVGALHDLTGEWTWPLLTLVALLVPKLVLGLIAAGPGTVDGEPRPGAPR
jgi:MFS transporter, CP family, cyanate transporter